MFRPMLACEADLTKLRFPLLASAKLDGVRAVVRDGVVYSRSNKPIPNREVQRKFAYLRHFDGELIVGEPTSPSCYTDTVSVVMSEDKPATNVTFFVFDHVEHLAATYRRRAEEIDIADAAIDVIRHEQLEVSDLDELLMTEGWALQEGYEGLILRRPDAPYKCGRSTANEGYLLKLKRFKDDEATIIGFEERMHNGNEATTNELGRTKRSSHKENKTGRGDLGAFICRTRDGIEFNIGTGFTDALRVEYWAAQDVLLGQLVKFKYFPVGVKEAPRHPVFLGLRDPRDL